jgi:chromosomal replication initiation ATPase DnaA
MDFWHQVLAIVEKCTNRQCLDTWFKPIIFHGCENGVLHLTVPTESFKKCLIDNYSSMLLSASREISKSVQTLDITSASVSAPESGSAEKHSTDAMDSPPLLSPKYTFDTFVVGTSNQLARAAALAVGRRRSGKNAPDACGWQSHPEAEQEHPIDLHVFGEIHERAGQRHSLRPHDSVSPEVSEYRRTANG